MGPEAVGKIDQRMQGPKTIERTLKSYQRLTKEEIDHPAQQSSA